MKITYIRLEKFKRFALREADVFEHHFTRKLTMITGANGAGKSSLFGELSPLPADKNHYHKGGSKEIHLSKDGVDYVLVSSFKDSAHHSFLQSGVELNPSGTVTVQKDLCAIHFSITPSVHELLTGAESFTEMGLAARKKLFNSVTHLNIESILKSYESLREELRNNDYALKSLQSRLLVEEQKLMDEGRKEVLQGKLRQMQEHIEHLLGIHAQVSQHRRAPQFEEAATGYQQALEDLHALHRQNLLSLSAYPACECDAQEAKFKADLAHSADRLQGYYGEMERLLHQQKSLDFATACSAEELQVRAREIEAAQQRLAGHLKLVEIDTPCLAEVSAQLNLLEHSLPDILEGMPDNPERTLGKSAYITAVEQKNQLLERQHTLLKEHSELKATLAQLERHQAMTCPKCTHTWLPHEVVGLLQKTNAELSVNVRGRAELEGSIAALAREEERQGQYTHKLQQLTALYAATKSVLGAFWRVIVDGEMIYQRPASLLTLVSQGISEVIDIQKHQQLELQRKELTDQSRMLQTASQSSHKENQSAIAALERKISDAMDKAHDLRQSLKDVQRARQLHTKVALLHSASEHARSLLQSAQLKHVCDATVREIDAELSLCKISVIETQNELGQHQAIEQGVRVLREQVLEAEQNVKVLTALTNELSPKNGFIAKSVSQFLNAIIGSINAVIAGVWDYKMVIKAIDVENDALNYRFKLEVEDRLTVDDISKASAGMREIINLAMKVTLYKLLRLENYVAYLDEFGVKLDSSHRARVADVIFKMMASSTYSQIFLITHLDLAYGDFKDTEVIEL